MILPVLAGFLLTVSDIRLLLILDVCTFFVTVATTLMTVTTLGMLASSVILGGINIKMGYAGLLSISLLGAGIFMASLGMWNQTISSQVGLHYNHVANWRNRFLAALPSLREIETGAPEKLEEEIQKPGVLIRNWEKKESKVF